MFISKKEYIELVSKCGAMTELSNKLQNEVITLSAKVDVSKRCILEAIGLLNKEEIDKESITRKLAMMYSIINGAFDNVVKPDNKA